MDVIGTLKAIVVEAEEARAFASKKRQVEREIADAERSLGKLQKDIQTANEGLSAIQAKAGEEQARFEHEKRRYAGMLEAQKAAVEQAANDLQAQHAKEAADAKAAHRGALSAVGFQQEQLDKDIASRKVELARLQSLVDDFKRRLTNTLPG